jgi:hypothetical protein
MATPLEGTVVKKQREELMPSELTPKGNKGRAISGVTQAEERWRRLSLYCQGKTIREFLSLYRCYYQSCPLLFLAGLSL